jgi:hypothetical protein
MVNGTAVAAFLRPASRGEAGPVNAGNIVAQDGFTGIALARFAAPARRRCRAWAGTGRRSGKHQTLFIDFKV